MKLIEKFREADRFSLTKATHDRKCEEITHDFAVDFAEWSIARALGCDSFKLNDSELEIYRKEKEL